MVRAARMARAVAIRLTAIAAVALVASAVTFFLLRITRDPVAVVASLRGMNPADPSVRRQLAAELGTDRSLVAQYLDWLWHALHGDLGVSYSGNRQKVTTLLGRGLAFNLELTFLSQVMALAIAVPVGLLAGSRVGSRIDRGLRLSTVAMLSFPAYVLAVLLITIFAAELGWFPVTAAQRPDFTADPAGHLRALTLPVLALSVPTSGIYARVLRSSVAATLQSDFVLAARSKGLSTLGILRRHVLRPSAGPMAQLVGVQTASLLGGSIFIEQVFAVSDGFGRAMATAAITADVPIVLGVTTTMAVIFTSVMVLTDALLRFLDPRIGDG